MIHDYKSPSQFPRRWEALNPQKQRFSHFARGRKEVGRLGSEGRSKNVPAHTGSREMS